MFPRASLPVDMEAEDVAKFVPGLLLPTFKGGGEVPGGYIPPAPPTGIDKSWGKVLLPTAVYSEIST